jgi:zinc protease
MSTFVSRVPARLLWLLLLWSPLASAVLPIEHWTTSRGARVYFVRATTIPMLDVNIDFDAGARHDPAGKDGLASMTGAMLARGSQGRDEEQIAERLADLGTIRGGGTDDDRLSASIRTLSSAPERDAAIELLSDLVARPTFPAPLLAREKDRSLQSLRESLTQPGSIAQRTFYPLIYPRHPYGTLSDAKTIAAVTRDDLVAFHRARFGASGAVLSMVGNITREQAQAIAERLTRDLPAGEPAAAMPPIEPVAAVERRIAHPASQSHILLGAPLISRGDPDFFPLFVGNYVLGGGGFVSRLTNEVREKRGLSYSVGSGFTPMLQPGPFVVSLQTQKGQTDQALAVVRETLTRFIEDGPTEAEMLAARQNLVGGFALRIDSNSKILGNLATIGWYGLPLDYLDRWTEQVDRVTREQVREAFRRRIDPTRLVTVIVGAGDATP